MVTVVMIQSPLHTGTLVGYTSLSNCNRHKEAGAVLVLLCVPSILPRYPLLGQHNPTQRYPVLPSWILVLGPGSLGYVS